MKRTKHNFTIGIFNKGFIITQLFNSLTTTHKHMNFMIELISSLKTLPLPEGAYIAYDYTDEIEKQIYGQQRGYNDR
jgi:hypothetical protein